MVPADYMVRQDQLEAAPPPLEIQGPTPDTNHHLRKKCTTIFCKLLLLCYIVWSVCLLVMQPKLPKYKVEFGTVQLNQQGYQLTGQWDMTLLGFNPNNYFNIHYKQVEAGIVYQIHWGDDLFTLYTLVRKPWPSLVLNKRNQTRASFKFGISQQHLGFQEAREISNEAGVFQLRFSSAAWFVSKLLPPKLYKMQVACKVPHNNGTITFTSEYSRKCKVVVTKYYIYEAVIISTYIMIVVWACCTWCDSKPRKTSSIAPR